MEDEILALAVKYNGNFGNILMDTQLKELIAKECVTKEQKNSAKKFVKEKGYKYTTLDSEDYPPNVFKEMISPPFVLFYMGNLNLLDAIGYDTLINVTGTKTYDAYGEKVTKQVVKELCGRENCIIVTGNNCGVESIIMDTVIKENGRIIIVYNGGREENEEKSLDEILKLLKENNYSEKDYLIVTQYPNTVCNEKESDKNSRQMRTTRIAIAASDKLLITASTKDHLHSSYVATRADKKVFVVPAPYDNKKLANNQLIAKGKNILTTVDNLFEDYD